MSTIMYVVRGVPSADILQVCKPEAKDCLLADCERISLTGVKPPKVGRILKDDVVPEDDFGFEAREFVRKNTIGKTVKFVKETYVEQLKRAVGEVLYQDQEKKVKNLGVELARAGLAEVDEAAKPGDVRNKVIEAQMEAVREGRGKYGGQKPRSGVTWEAFQEHVDALSEFQGKRFEAVVEQVMTGHMLRVYLKNEKMYVQVQLTGILCDKKENTDAKLSPEERQLLDECHAQAKVFAEKNLLHRDVTLVLEGKFHDSLLASVLDTDKGIVFQEVLLRRGLARIFDGPMGTVANSKDYRTKLREAEKAAQDGKAGRWRLAKVQRVVGGKDAKAEEEKPELEKHANFEGKLAQIISPDLLVITDSKTGKDVKIALASVRGGGSTNIEPPKKQEGGERGGYSGKSSNFAHIERTEDGIVYHNFFLEGRDLVAEQLLDKTLKVEVDYMSEVALQQRGEDREAGKDDVKKELRINASVYYPGKGGRQANIATELVKAGFASPMGSRDGSAKDADLYRDAFLEAKEAKRGLHGAKGKGTHAVQEIKSLKPGDKPNPTAQKKGHSMLAYLQRAGGGAAGIPKLPVTVEQVLSPARVKLYVPRENVLISCNVAGIAAPLHPLPGQTDPADPCADEALAFARSKLLARKIEAQVEHFHKGTYVVNLFVGGQNYAHLILAEGLATTFGQNLQSMSGGTTAQEIEKKARAARLGIHAPGQGLPKRATDRQAEYEKKFAGRATFVLGDGQRVKATITELLNSTTFFFQTEESKKHLAKIDQQLHALAPESSAPPDIKDVKFDQLVAAKFSEDKKWYRARVANIIGNKVEVVFIDFGNREKTDVKMIRIDPRLTLEVPPQAQEGHLAFLYKLGLDEIGGSEAAAAFEDFVGAGNVTIAHEYTSQRKKFYTVRVGERPVQAALIKEGLALVALDVQDNADLAKPVGVLTKLEAAAKQSRIGMWSQLRGDPRNDDDDRY